MVLQVVLKHGREPGDSGGGSGCTEGLGIYWINIQKSEHELESAQAS